MLLNLHITTESMQGNIYSQESRNDGGTRTTLGKCSSRITCFRPDNDPRLELVAGSRATGLEHFAIRNELSLLDKNHCRKLGKHQPIYHTDSFKKISEQRRHSLSKEPETGSINWMNCTITKFMKVDVAGSSNGTEIISNCDTCTMFN